jgi:hypothetical protein
MMVLKGSSLNSPARTQQSKITNYQGRKLSNTQALPKSTIGPTNH